ncbi:MAG: 2'-5' RNA ligase family protein [Erysipelotrichaceae bacterium]|nr:2'-5' RNA ligase family protein [Erysipelotrichaceae bacterium]
MKRNICIILTFDEQTTNKLQSLKRELYAFDIEFKTNHPHITIANYPGIRTNVIKKYVKHFFMDIEPFPIVFNQLKLLNEHLLVIEPIDNPRLNEIYHTFHEAYGKLANKWTSIEELEFRPHITIYFDRERDMKKIKKHMLLHFTSFTGYITGVEVSEVSDGDYKILDRLEFKYKESI